MATRANTTDPATAVTAPVPKAVDDDSTSAPRAPNVIAFQKPGPSPHTTAARGTPGEVVALSLAMGPLDRACWLDLGRIFAAKGGRV